MALSTIYYGIGIILVLTPLPALLYFGPKYNHRRGIYALVGLISGSLIGLSLYLIKLNERFPDPESAIARISRSAFAGLFEEVFRYPSILFAVYLGNKYTSWSKNDVSKLETTPKYTFVDDKFTSIKDPHGLGMYFGVGYGMVETFAVYIYPRILLIILSVDEYVWQDDLLQIILRITAVMAHTALTYLSMAITQSKVFWRLTILLHTGVNVLNRVFYLQAPNETSSSVVILFTRFALILIAYFMLRPRVRYMSPAVLLFLLVILFLITILISTIVFLMVGLLSSGIFDTFR